MWPRQDETLTLNFLPLTADLPLWAKPTPPQEERDGETSLQASRTQGGGA